MKPKFSKSTIETLAKRAGYICSNPDCRKSTVGPNSDPNKSTLIGEAAHIFGAQPIAKRYRAEMTDHSRAETTNGIWLCRNCHKLIDTDEIAYSAELMFRWREIHENYVAKNLGESNDLIRFELEQTQAEKFSEFPAHIKRIVLDKPEAWEWRLTAELMRELNEPIFRRYRDLKNNLYTGAVEHIEFEETQNWARKKTDEMSLMVPPFVGLFDELTASWGKQGESGNASEILHICRLIRDALQRILDFEETLYFSRLPPQSEKLHNLLKSCLGEQMTKLSRLPGDLNQAVSMQNSDHGGTVDDPTIIEKSITFEMPPDWASKVEREIRKSDPDYDPVKSFGETVGCLFWFCVILYVLFSVIF